MSDQPGRHRLERPRMIRRLWAGFALALAASIAAELLVPVEGRFGIDGSFAFDAWYGFGACIALVAVAKLLGLLLRRRDTYYGE